MEHKGEVQEVSDADGASATDDAREQDDKRKKKKRRRREVDMIRLDDDDDDEESGEESSPPYKKLQKLSSPGPQSPGHAGAREPRLCVLKASQKRKPLSRLLEQLLRNLEKRDPNQYFAWPVNDNFAPGYSSIIRRPMDFCTIKQKIDDNEYRSLNCFIKDFKLMCNNAMKYNKPGTVYHKAARRLLHAGLKQLAPAKLRPLGNMLTYMYEIPIRELGFDIGNMDVKVLNKSFLTKSGTYDGDPPSDSASDSKQDRGGGEHDIKIKMEAAREQHRKRLARKAFPRMGVDGKTTLCMVVEGANPTGNAAERQATLGNYVGRLQQGSGTLQSFREDRRNLVKGVKSLDYGPFSSYAPSYDSTFATLTKEDSHLLYHTYNAESGQGSEELLRFAPDSPWLLLYNMEELFPDKKKLAEAAAPAPEESVGDVKVDMASLRSLSELGIDVDFLQDMEEEVAASQHDYGLRPSLGHTYKLISKLHSEQTERLSTPPPAHLSLVPRPAASERELARCAVWCLRGMLARVQPQHVASVHSVRRAAGITLAHLDTPMSLDDFIELEMSGTDMRPEDLKNEAK